jgi:HK97 family phage prohead protease
VEKRFLATEVRAVLKGSKRTIAGYAARYGVLSGDLGGFRERIEPGAFKRVLATTPDVVCLFNHQDNCVLGRTTSGTLRLREDSNGLAFECDLPDTQAGRDTYASVQRGDLNGCSFAFMVDDQRMCSYHEEEIDEDEDEGDVRNKDGRSILRFRGAIKRKMRSLVRSIRDFASLIDVSVVTHPAYPQTSVDARNLLVGAEVRSKLESLKKRISVLEQITLSEPEQAEYDARERRRRLEMLDL